MRHHEQETNNAQSEGNYNGWESLMSGAPQEAAPNMPEDTPDPGPPEPDDPDPDLETPDTEDDDDWDYFGTPVTGTFENDAGIDEKPGHDDWADFATEEAAKDGDWDLPDPGDEPTPDPDLDPPSDDDWLLDDFFHVHDDDGFGDTPLTANAPSTLSHIGETPTFTGPDTIYGIPSVPEYTKPKTKAEIIAEKFPNAEHITEPPLEFRGQWSRRSVTETVRAIQSHEMQVVGETVMRAKSEVICDRDHIEGQRIDVINRRDRDGGVEVKFKLRHPSEATEQIVAKSRAFEQDGQEFTTTTGAVIRRSKIEYESTIGEKSQTLCDAAVYERNGLKIFVADPEWRDGKKCSTFEVARTAMGLVRIEAPEGTTPEDIEQALDQILTEDFGISGALEAVDAQSERDYKHARFKWQHKLDGPLTPEQMRQAEAMQREEVFPGYTTVVEKGKHKEYLERYGEDMRVFHNLYNGDAASIQRILAQGLMCTTERFSRGITRAGMSSVEDMKTGGADSVFTRMGNRDSWSTHPGTTVIFKPEVLDRTDWYAYSNDRFGTTRDDTFRDRLSPDEILSATCDPRHWPSRNEQMFRTGIGANYVEAIQVDASQYDTIVEQLRNMGITEFDGRPIEDVIIKRVEPTPVATSGDSPATANTDYVDPWASYEAAKKQKEAETAAKIQSIIDGTETCVDAEELVDLAYNGGDEVTNFKNLLNSTIVHGHKNEIATSMRNYLVEQISSDDLKILADGAELPDNIDSESVEIINYACSTLGFTVSELYQQKLQQEKDAAEPVAAEGGSPTDSNEAPSTNGLDNPWDDGLEW